MASAKNVEMQDENDFEKVYVDWPDDDDSDQYRFVSSRIENHETDELEFIDSIAPVSDKPDDRYEDYTGLNDDVTHNAGESIPPLELISQTSSVEMPGTKGVIDIDLRSSSGDDSSNITVQDSLNITHLPTISKDDLILNYSAYDSVKREEPILKSNSNNEIYKNEVEIFNNAQQKIQSINLKNQGSNHTAQNYKKITEQEYTVDNKGKQQKPTLSVAPQSQNDPNQTHLTNSKSIPNFVELNKTLVVQPKHNIHMVTTESYATKFNNNRSAKPNMKQQLKPLQKSCSMRNMTHENFSPEHQTIDSYQTFEPIQYPNSYIDPNNIQQTQNFPHPHSQYHYQYSTQYNHNNNFQQYNYPPNDYYNNYPQQHSQHSQRQHYPIQQQFQQYQRDNNNNSSQKLFFAMNKQGEPIIINTDQVIISPQQQHQYTQQSSATSSALLNSFNGHSYVSPRKLEPSTQYLQSEFINGVNNQTDIKAQNEQNDTLLKRQPTLYDTVTLDKKLHEVVAFEKQLSNTSSRFPPLTNSANSSSTKRDSSSYAAKFRRKNSNYEKYTLRDYRNIQNIEASAGLGPNTGTIEHQKMKEKLIRQKQYAKLVEEKNKIEIQKQLKTERKEITKDKNENYNENNGNELVESQINSDGADLMSEDEKITKHQDNEQLVSEELNTTKQTTNSSRNNNNNNNNNQNKRDVMLNYAKSVKDRQNKKKQNNTSEETANLKNTQNVFYHELFNTDDLDRLLERHESDKKVANQIRQRLGKIS